MGESNKLNIYQQLTPVNNAITVTYTPDESTVRYEYRIVKDGQVGDYIPIPNGNLTDIVLDSSGSYFIDFKEYDNYNKVNVGFLRQNSHQVFGTFTGSIRLDTEINVTIKDGFGFAEKVRNVW